MSNRILIVDDDIDFSTLLERQLIKGNFEVDHCTSTQQAINSLEIKEYGCILLDIFLGSDKTSVDLIKYIKSRDLNYKTPIVVMSANIDNNFKEILSKKKDVSFVVKKPFPKNEIYSIVDYLMREKIFIFDDDSDFIKLIKVKIEKHNIRLDHSLETNESIKKISLNRYKGAIFDILVDQNKTSDQVLKYLESESNKFNIDIPIAFMSAYLSDELIGKLSKKYENLIGAYKKPLNNDDILDFIEGVENYWKFVLSKNLADSTMNNTESQIDDSFSFSMDKLEDEIIKINGGKPLEEKSEYQLRADKMQKEEENMRVKGLSFQTSKGIQNLSMTELIQKIEEDPNFRYDGNETVLMLAVKQNLEFLVELCFKYGSDLNLKNKNGDSAIVFAVQRKNYELVEKLASAGTHLKSKNSHGMDVLYYALRNNDMKMVELLHKFGANIRGRYKGKNYLMLALKGCKDEVVNYLVKAGIPISETDDYGNDANFYAKKHKRSNLLVKK
ncbi:MAG: ankyrin repeat domain-containing protein [Halobacteriovoraceae bacterium]|nr:ankyrin repeat domain-containing protein [Halobacteriovoraceae bacterium]